MQAKKFAMDPHGVSQQEEGAAGQVQELAADVQVRFFWFIVCTTLIVSICTIHIHLPILPYATQAAGGVAAEPEVQVCL